MLVIKFFACLTVDIRLIEFIAMPVLEYISTELKGKGMQTLPCISEVCNDTQGLFKISSLPHVSLYRDTEFLFSVDLLSPSWDIHVLPVSNIGPFGSG